MPSTMIGLFQCPPPHSSVVTSTPLSGWYTRSPPFASNTYRRPPARTGLVPRFEFFHAWWSWPPLTVHAAVPPPSPANIHVVPLGACHTAGAVNNALLD